MVTDFHELRVYSRAYGAAMRLFALSKKWPKEETYALTDQIRRSSRSVCASIAEAWCKRRYQAHFISKLSDAEAEAAETLNWINFAFDCGYLSEGNHAGLSSEYAAVRGGLVRMMSEAHRWCGPSQLREPSVEYGMTSRDDDA